MTVDLWSPATSDDVEWLSVLAEARPTLDDLGSRMPAFTWREVLHPAYWIEDDEVVREVTWAEVARAHGSDVHSAAHFNALVGLHVNDFENGFDDPSAVWNWPPEQGTLPLRQHEALLSVLRAHTNATDGVCGVWAGWASAHRLTETPGAPRREVTQREVVFFRSPLDAFAASVDEVAYQAANVMFPLDHRWIVITDCDDWLTYIGAEAEIVTALEHADAFEVRGPTPRRQQ
ncbi:hypothetical protein ACU61A_29935 [Pseudonocardia sichuanensis]